MCSFVSGFFNKHGWIPSVEEIVEVYDMPKPTEDTYARKKLILTFYAEDLVRACVGEDQWPLEVAKVYTMVSYRDENDKDKGRRVTAKGEATLRVIYANCKEKWDKILPIRKDKPGWTVPLYNKDDSTTHDYWKTKWSDMHSGKTTDGGWDPAAFAAFNAHLKDIVAFRKKDAKRGFKVYKKMLKWIRDKHKVAEKEALQSRKRKRKGTQEKVGKTMALFVLCIGIRS